MGLWPTGSDENPGAPFLPRSSREKCGFSTERNRSQCPLTRTTQPALYENLAFCQKLTQIELVFASPWYSMQEGM